MGSCLCQQTSYISEFMFISVTYLSRRFLIIVNHYSIHRLQLGVVNYLIDPTIHTLIGEIEITEERNEGYKEIITLLLIQFYPKLLIFIHVEHFVTGWMDLP